jgi:hypothetical protein
MGSMLKWGVQRKWWKSFIAVRNCKTGVIK